MTKPDLTEVDLPDLTHLSQKNGGKFPFDRSGSQSRRIQRVRIESIITKQMASAVGSRNGGNLKDIVKISS